MSIQQPEVGGGGSRLKRAQRKCRSQRQGFTLMELITVITIVGILSAIAIPTFSSYIYKSRTSEATEFLGVIRLREESYRAEFGVYCPSLDAASVPNAVASLNTMANLTPDPSLGSPSSHRDTKPFVTNPQWMQLGARPSGQVRFGYGVVAGTPGTAAAQGLGWNAANADFWFVAHAVGDLDGDNVFATFEIYSASKGVWIGTNGAQNTKGWD